MPAEALTPRGTLRDLLDGIAEAPAIDVGGISSDSKALMRGGWLFRRQIRFRFCGPDAGE
jgi:hypothetical protein